MVHNQSECCRMLAVERHIACSLVHTPCPAPQFSPGWSKVGSNGIPTGFRSPRVVESATSSYQAQSNPIADFVAEACILDPSAFTALADLRGAYASWVHRASQPTRRSAKVALHRRLDTTAAHGTITRLGKSDQPELSNAQA